MVSEASYDFGKGYDKDIAGSLHDIADSLSTLAMIFAAKEGKETTLEYFELSPGCEVKFKKERTAHIVSLWLIVHEINVLMDNAEMNTFKKNKAIRNLAAKLMEKAKGLERDREQENGETEQVQKAVTEDTEEWKKQGECGSYSC